MWHNPVTSVDISGYQPLCFACVDSSGRISSFSDDCSGDTKVYKSIKRDLSELAFSLNINSGTDSSSSSSSSSTSGGWHTTGDMYSLIFESDLPLAGENYYYDGASIVAGGSYPYYSYGNAYLIWSAVYGRWVVLALYYGVYYYFLATGDNNASQPAVGNYYFEYDYGDYVTISQINT